MSGLKLPPLRKEYGENPFERMHLEEELAVARLLFYSWEPIDFEYDGLTSQEQQCLSRETHGNLVCWLSHVFQIAGPEAGTISTDVGAEPAEPRQIERSGPDPLIRMCTPGWSRHG